MNCNAFSTQTNTPPVGASAIDAGITTLGIPATGTDHRRTTEIALDLLPRTTSYKDTHDTPVPKAASAQANCGAAEQGNEHTVVTSVSCACADASGRIAKAGDRKSSGSTTMACALTEPAHLKIFRQGETQGS